MPMVAEVKREDATGERIHEATLAFCPPAMDVGRTSGPTRKSKGGWTDEEDDMLTKAVRQFNGKNWKKIAELLPDRTDMQCNHRWHRVLNPEIIKGTWSKEEDDIIIQLVEKHGCKNWSVIAKSLPGRIRKQCRERWHNHLNPAIKKDAWTREEEEVLVCAYQIYGTKWVEIAKYLPGRTNNSIKNHWNCYVKKRADSILASGFIEQHLGALALDLNNHVQNAECPKADPLKRFATDFISYDWKLNADRLITSNGGLGHQNTSPNKQCLDLQSTSKEDSRCLRAESVPVLPEYSKGLSIVAEYSKGLSIVVESITENDSKCMTLGEINYEFLQSIQQDLSNSGDLVLRDVNKNIKDTRISNLPACKLSDGDRTAGINRILTIPPRLENGNFGSLCYSPLQLMEVDGCLSSEKFSKSEDHIQTTQSPVHCSTPSELSLSIPSMAESILRSAAKSFKKTPSIMRRRRTKEL